MLIWGPENKLQNIDSFSMTIFSLFLAKLKLYMCKVVCLYDHPVNSKSAKLLLVLTRCEPLIIISGFRTVLESDFEVCLKGRIMGMS